MNIDLQVTADLGNGKELVAEHTIWNADRMDDGGRRLERMMLGELLLEVGRGLVDGGHEYDGVTVMIERIVR